MKPGVYTLNTSMTAKDMMVQISDVYKAREKAAEEKAKADAQAATQAETSTQKDTQKGE